MVNITFKDLFHEPSKFILVILGLSVAIMMVNFGDGCIENVQLENQRFLEKNPQFDAYVTQRNRMDIYSGGRVYDIYYNMTKDSKAVKNVEKLIIGGYGLKIEDEIAGVRLIGYNLDSEITPWDVVEGKEANLEENYTLLVDNSVKRFLPDLKVGDKVESSLESKVEIVGFCENSKHWTNGIAWCSFETAQLLYHMENENASSVLAVELKEGYTAEDLQDDLKEGKDDIIVHSREEMLQYLADEVEGNMGSSIGMLAMVGFLVTMIIIAATMYSTVMEKIPQLVTFKALGAGQGFINKMLIGQVFIFLTVSTLLGLFFTYLIQPFVSMMSVYGMSINLLQVLINYGICLNLGILVSLFSMRKVKRTDPAVIFRG